MSISIQKLWPAQDFEATKFKLTCENIEVKVSKVCCFEPWPIYTYWSQNYEDTPKIRSKLLPFSFELKFILRFSVLLITRLLLFLVFIHSIVKLIWFLFVYFNKNNNDNNYNQICISFQTAACSSNHTPYGIFILVVVVLLFFSFISTLKFTIWYA